MTDTVSLVLAAVIASLTGLLAFATWVMATATKHLATETRLQREESTRPRLNARLEFPQAPAIELWIENFSSASALNVGTRIDGQVPDWLEPLGDLPFFQQGCLSIHPGSRIRFHAGVFKEDGAGEVFGLVLSYASRDGRQFEETFQLDLGSVRGALARPESDLSKLVKVLDRRLPRPE